MEKEGLSNLFNSRGGKVNILLLVSIVLIFVIMMISAEAITIRLVSPGNRTINGSRNVNFTFNVTWSLDTETDQGSNCSVWTNATSQWGESRVNNTLSNVSNWTSAGGLISWMNYTFPSDGNYSWSIGCHDKGNTLGSALTFPHNYTFFIDSVAPEVVPTFSSISEGPPLNITSYETAIIYANVTDNSTRDVFMILYSGASTIPEPTSTNESVNRTMTLNSTLSFDKRVYYANLSGVLNFNSSFTSPGIHSVVVCANDSQRRLTCSAKKDFIITGGNATQIENMFASMQQGITGLAFGGLNITLGNGTELPEDTFMNTVTGVTVGGLTHKNFTFIFNFSANFIVHIVAGRIDESQFANASQSKINSTPTVEVRNQLGTGFTATGGWADIRSFIPSAVSYEYGIIQIGGTHGKKMYCNGTTMDDPQCHPISQCNGSVFTIYNYTSGQTSLSSGVIPSNDACWLESGTINGQALSSGYTYLFVDKFSGGYGPDDFSQINVTFNGALYENFSTSAVTTAMINFTLEDINSTGLNLTINNSINVSVWQGGTKIVFFSYNNSVNANITCINIDTDTTRGSENTTAIRCNVTYTFNANSSFLINVTARDTSNNSNPVNVTDNNSRSTAITIIVDQIPPVFGLYNFTNSTNATDGSEAIELSTTTGRSRAQGDASTGRIMAVANWTDNLTNAQVGKLQFYNESTPDWQTINTTAVNGTNGGYKTGGWTNMSFRIPTGHNNFEGRNVSFRIVVNDSVGNVNTSVVKNFTILINDTTTPTLLVSSVGGLDVLNFSNISDTTPTIVWNVTENNPTKYIAIQIDSSSPTGVDPTCNLFVNYSTIASSSLKRNASITVKGPSDDPQCNALTNGTHTIRLTTEDSWGNSELYLYSFVVETQVPGIILSTLQNITSVAFPTGISAVNNSNVTPYTGINITAVNGATATIKNMSFISSCNSTVQTFTNMSFIWPFNYSVGVCKRMESNQTVTITVFDSVGNSNTTVFGFTVDDAAPSIGVHSPVNGLTYSDIIIVNVSAFDSMSRVDTIGYYLDDSPVIFNHTINGSALTVAQGQNTSALNRTINFTPGTHTIKITVNDTMGNRRNSSPITFTQTGPVRPSEINSSMNTYITTLLTFPSNVTIKKQGSGGDYQEVGSANETDANGTFEVVLNLNSSSSNNINVTLTGINGSAVNWNKINFSVFINESKVQADIQNNWTSGVIGFVIFNNSLEEFTNNNNNSYYGVVTLPLNDSWRNASGPEFWWIENEGILTTRTNISQCTAAFTRTTPTPCWNYTSGGRTLVFVPHFSIVLIANNTGAPTVNLTTPQGSNPNQTVGTFVPNITVSLDAVSCIYSINGTVAGQAMTLSGGICLGQTEKFKNLNAVDGGYNMTFNVTDSSGNKNTYIWKFNVSDNEAPNSPNSSRVTSVDVTSSQATVNLGGFNESVNATVQIANGSSISPGNQPDFNQTQAVVVSGLSASTTYHYNITVCDFNGNCAVNSTGLTFTTSAAAAAAAAAAASSSSGGGGGAATPSNEVATASRRWDSLAAGASAVLTINKENIAVTGVIVDVKNAVTNAEVKVGSLASNPLSIPAAAKVYQYLQITRGNIADTDTSKISINFRVPKSWLTSNGVKEDDVVLYRYSESKWNGLSTSKTGSDANNVLYSATTPGFSTFAIGGKEAAPAVTPPTEAPVPPAPTGEVAAPPTEAPKAPEEKAMEKKGLSNTAIAWIVVIIIGVIAAVGYYMWQKKKEE